MKKKKKTVEKRKQFFPLLLTGDKVVLRYQLKREPQFSLKVYCQKQIAIMTQCFKNQPTEAAVLRCSSK